MSPFVVRRYRAERLLRDEFDRLRARVIGGVSRRLRTAGVRMDAGDLDACYAQAWQGLYAAVLDGTQIDNPSAWLALVTYRRAVDEHRSRRAIDSRPFDDRREAGQASAAAVTGQAACRAGERDIAAELDDRARLRQLFEALRVRLSEREQQAATLCYLQGLSRADAATCMGISESRMRKLMEGRGAGSPGVASKMGALVHTIGAGEWCEEQGSLMRGLAYGILDPEGERHRLALLHRDTCPGCRAYVLSLRGLAAVLPPAPVLLHWALGAGAAGGVAAGGVGGATGVGGAVGQGGAGATTSAAAVGPAGSAAAGGALSASGAAGVGAVGGGWWLAGGLGAKLAVGCLLALGVGAGCVALGGGAGGVRAPSHHHRATREAHVGSPRTNGSSLAVAQAGPSEQRSGRARESALPATHLASASQASREFGLEQTIASSQARSTASTGRVPSARAASAGGAPKEAKAGGTAQASAGTSAGSGTSSGGVPAAQREFSPG